MRFTITSVFFLMCFVPLNAWAQTGAVVSYREPPSKQVATPDKTDQPATSETNIGTPPKRTLRVFLTRRKSWLSSGGFTRTEHGNEHSPAPDFTKDFHKRCPKAEITDMQDSANYAVTIDEIGLVDSFTRPDAPTFQVSVYSRSAGLLYTGGTSFLKNAVKDACNAIGAK